MPWLSSRPSTTGAGAAGSMTVGSAERMISGLVTPISASSSLEWVSRRVMASTLFWRTLEARRRLEGEWMGPMPQPYIITWLPSRLAQEMVKR